MPRRTLLQRTILTSLLLVLVSMLSACSSPKTDPSVASNVATDDKKTVLAYANPMVDNLLSGYNKSDYAAFSKDMSDNLKNSATQDYFKNLIQGIVYAKVGKYQSRSVDQMDQTTTSVTIIYKAKFEKDNPVTVRVSFDLAEPHKINELVFDSANLNK